VTPARSRPALGMLLSPGHGAGNPPRAEQGIPQSPSKGAGSSESGFDSRLVSVSPGLRFMRYRIAPDSGIGSCPVQLTGNRSQDSQRRPSGRRRRTGQRRTTGLSFEGPRGGFGNGLSRDRAQARLLRHSVNAAAQRPAFPRQHAVWPAKPVVAWIRTKGPDGQHVPGRNRAGGNSTA